jgi:hypothetical protein
MKKILFFLLILPAMLLAAPVDSNLAQQVAANFFENSIQENVVRQRKASLLPVRHAGIKKIRRSSGQNYEPYYVFNNADGGFVIVAGDDRVQPILAYSANGEFAQDCLPIQVMEWLDMYSEQIQYIVDNNLSNDSIADLWDASAPYRVKTSNVVAPLIQTHWDQAPLYNDKCPYDANLSPLGFHPTVGCVACAMGQIMKYWEFPSIGIGSHSYNSANYGTLSANFGRTQYDWANMPEQLTASSTETQINAVSTLLYHCGISVDMNYNSDGQGSSGAYTVLDARGKAQKATAEEAFVDYFGYKASAVTGKFMSDYSYSNWVSLLKNELNNNRPMLYSGSTSSGGHAFICDGYDSNDYFHFNWGWGGAYDGYFALSSSTPLIYYNQGQRAIIGIIPDQATQEYDLAMYADLETASSTYTFGNDISITGQVENNGTGTFMGVFRVGLYNSNDQFMGWSNESYSFTLTGGGHTVAKTFTFTGGIPYITGKYTAYMFYKENGSSQWHSVRSDVGVFLTEYNNVSFNITYKTNSLRTYSAFTVSEGKYVVGNTTHINVDVLNAGSSTFYGKIKLCLKNADGSAVQDIDEYAITSGLNANTHYTNGLNFVGVISANPGTYYLTLLFQKSGETSWYYVGCDQYQNPTPINVVAPPLIADNFEENDTQATASVLVPDFEETEMPTFGTNKVSLHTTTDIDYYKINFPAGYKYSVTIDLYDSYNQNGSIYYSGDAKLAYSIDGQTYSKDFDSGVDKANRLIFEGPRTMYIRVTPYITEWIGTYEIAGHVTREKIGNSGNDISISAKMPSNWGTTISAWIWADGSNGSWATITKNGEWYSYTSTVNPLNIIFVNGNTWNGDNNQTIDIRLTESTCLQIGNNTTGKRTYSVVDCPSEESQLTHGKYVIVANRDKDGDKNWYYMTSDLGTASNKRFQAVSTNTENLGDIVTKDLEDKYIWELVEDGENWKLKNSSDFVTWTSGNSANLAATGKTLTCDVTDNAVQVHFNDGSAERYLAMNQTTGNNYFAFYTGSNQIRNLVFLPCEEKIVPPARDCKNVPYTETFASSQGDFTVQNVTLSSGFTSIWNWDSQYGMVAKCIKGSTKYESKSYLISPCIELPENAPCVLTFSHAAKFFQNTDQMSLWISTNYDDSDPESAQWNKLVIPNYPTGANWNWYESGDIDLSAYSGQGVNIAFCYTSTTSYAPQWEIKNFAVKPSAATLIESVQPSQSSATKVLRNGQLFILRDGSRYTATGVKVE